MKMDAQVIKYLIYIELSQDKNFESHQFFSKVL